MNLLPKTKSLMPLDETAIGKSRSHLSSLSSEILSDGDMVRSAGYHEKSTYSVLMHDPEGVVLTQRELTKKLMQLTPGLFSGFRLPSKIAKNIFTVNQHAFEVIKDTERRNSITMAIISVLSLILAIVQNDLRHSGGSDFIVQLIRTVIG
jgi:hypothetical protein